MNNVTLVLLIVFGLVVVGALVAGGSFTLRQKRTERLQDLFGPEYDREVAESGSQREAEAELRARERRHEEVELRPLTSDRRDQFERRWADLQGWFVDNPGRAVADADLLVIDVMSARGFPTDDFERRTEDLSVRYPEITQRYREARHISQANQRGEAGTEDLRQAAGHYRSLIEVLLADPVRKGAGDSAK